jgi:hypothetical protein
MQPRMAAEGSMKSLAFARGSRADRPYLVLIHTAAEPDAVEWQMYITAVRGLLSKQPGLVRTFVATDGGGPNAAQRKALADVIHLGPGDLLTHVFTTSTLIRSVVTAFRWLAGSRAIAHPPREFTTVCRGYGVETKDVLDDFTLVQKQLEPVAMLQEIERALPRQQAPAP